MRRLHLSISGLLALVAVVAIGFAAIHNATPSWAGGLYSLTFFLLVASLLGILFGQGPRRVFWTGFALLGWSYILLHFVPWNGRYLGPYLLAPSLFDAIYDELHITDQMKNSPGFVRPQPGVISDSIPAGSGGLGGMMSGMGGMMGMGGTGGGFRNMMGGLGGPPGPPPVLPTVDPPVFVRIGMGLEALLWAFLGGWAARYFASGRSGRPRPEVAVAPA